MFGTVSLQILQKIIIVKQYLCTMISTAYLTENDNFSSIIFIGSQSTTQSVPTVSTTSTTTTPSMTTSSTTSTTTSPSVSTSSTTSTTTTPSVSTSSTTSTTTPQPISCPPDGSGFTTVQLEDGNYFTYRVAKMLASQETAIQSCTNHGSFLARVTTVAKMNMLLQLIRTCSGYNSGLYDYYVDGSNAGATDFFAPGAWVMSNGDLVPMSNDFWGDMKPNYPETQHCLRMTADINFMWDDCSCSLEHYFICEK